MRDALYYFILTKLEILNEKSAINKVFKIVESSFSESPSINDWLSDVKCALKIIVYGYVHYPRIF